ncbi:MAG: DUF177 domain-containing protein [Methylocystis sp.]|nr:DUF177 domain-containing protein [Methylocystis sp.]
MSQLTESAPPLSRRLALADIPPDGLEIEIVATPSERAALAALNALPDVASFEAKLRAQRWRGDGLEVEGEIRARLRQICVMTLDPFETECVAPVAVRFAPLREETSRSRQRKPGSGGETHDLASDEAPDPLIGDAVDLGAIATEFFTLALDPYPKKPGAKFTPPAAEAVPAPSPFAALRGFKTGPRSN